MNLIKLAASFDAQRTKQYWQMLKRLHGGTDEAMAAIKKSGDDGIWHGTRKEYMPEIAEEGLKPGGFREFGTGTFFGNKETASLYGDDVVMSGKFRAGNLYDPVAKRRINDPEEMKAYVRANPDDKYSLSEGDLVRMAKPSELRGTKTLYPDPSKVKVFDIQEPGDLAKVAPSQTSYLDEDKGVKRLVALQKMEFRKAEPEEQAAMLRDVITRKAQRDGTPMDAEDLTNEVRELQAILQRGDNREVTRSLQGYERFLSQDAADTLMTPRNQAEQNALQYYGKLRGKRVFDRLNPEGIRKEFFVDREGVAPELLRRQDGTAFPVAQPLKAEPVAEKPLNAAPVAETPRMSEAEASQTAEALVPDEKRRSLWPYVGLGGAGVGAGLAYRAHQRKKEEKKV